MGNKKSIGLPGGPNEFLQDITQYISVDGYRRDSVDKTNPVNFIPSGDISMKDVDFPIIGTDNLGNSQMMFPENEYQFPGDMVMEIPQAQFGIKKKLDQFKTNLANNYRTGIGYNNFQRDVKGIDKYGDDLGGEGYLFAIKNALTDIYNAGTNAEVVQDDRRMINEDADADRADTTTLEQNAFRLYLQQQQNAVNPNNKLNISDYRPSIGDTPEDVYYSIPPAQRKEVYGDNAFPESLSYNGSDFDWKELEKKYSGQQEEDMVVGTYTKGIGRNDDGSIYLSAYDKWDLNPLSQMSNSSNPLAKFIGDNVGDLSMGLGKPFNIYDRVNYVPESPGSSRYVKQKKVPEKQLGGLVKQIIKQAPKYMDDITKNAYKYNPWAYNNIDSKLPEILQFNRENDSWLRQVGRPAIDDAKETGVVREINEVINPKLFDEKVKALQNQQTGINFSLDKRYPGPFFKKGETFFDMNKLSKNRKLDGLRNTRGRSGSAEYLIETGPSIGDDLFQPAYQQSMFRDFAEKGIGDIAIMKPFSREASNFNFYKKDWWDGYKRTPLDELQSGGGVLGAMYKLATDDNYKWTDALYDSSPLPGISNALDVVSIPGALVGEAGEYFTGRGDGEFNFSDAMPALKGDFSFENVNGTQIKDLAGLKDKDGNPLVENAWGAFALNVLTDPSSYVGAGLLKAGVKKTATKAAPLIKKALTSSAKSTDDIIKATADDMVEVLTADGSKKLMKKADAIRLNRIEDANVNNKTFTNYEDGNWFSDDIQPFYLNNAKNTLKGGILNSKDPKRVMSAYLDPEYAKLFDVSTQGTSVARNLSGGKGNLPMKGEYVLPPALVKSMREGTSGLGYNTMIGNSESIMQNLDAFYKKLGGGVYQEGGDVRVPKRKGVRNNEDGTESTHLMRTESLDGENWFSFPSLFQDEDGTWIDMSKEKDWMLVYEEAKRRGEVIDFGTDKETAIKFGEGSWKTKMQKGGGWRDIDVDIEGVKKAIAQAESLGGKLMKNKESTASGLYGQRFSELDKYNLYDGTRDEFIADKDAQERIFNMRLNEGLVSKNGDTITTPLLKDAYDLTVEYKDQLGDDWDYSYEDIINLSNFIGRGGTRKYFGDVIRDGKKLEDVYPTLFGPNAKQKNKTPEEYLKISREFYKAGGSVSWNWKGKSYSGTLIPSMENEKNRYARTENGKIKTLPKGQYGNREVFETKVDNTSVARLPEFSYTKNPIVEPQINNPFGSYAGFDPSEFEVSQDKTYVDTSKYNIREKQILKNLQRDNPTLSIEELEKLLGEEETQFEQYQDPVLIADFIKKSNYYAEGWKDMRGASDGEIKDLQEVLLSRGYDIGGTGIDGKYGNRTYAAHRSMVDDSNLDPTSITRYYKNYTKDTYDEVKGIQNILVTKGYMNPLLTNRKSSSIDGKFGDQTKNALDAYNTDNFKDDPKATVFNNIPSKLDEPRCAAGMCNILEGNGVLTEAIGVKYKDAWDLFESMEGADNSTSIYNIYDSNLFDNIDVDTPIELLKDITGKVKKKSQTKASDYKIGDIVGLYWQGSSHHEETLGSKTHNTHSGFVSNIVDGVPIITHNVNGKVIQQPYNELSTAWIRRPNEDVEIKSKYEITDDINSIGTDELAIVNLETKYNSKLSNKRRDVVANILQRATYNSTKIPEILNSSVDPAWLKSATFGITGVESGVGFNAPRTVEQARSENAGLQGIAYDIAGKEDSGISLGIGKTKFASLDKFARQYFDINSPEDLADDNKAVDAVSYILTKNYELFKDYAKQYPSLGLTEQDIRNMAILSYNQGSNRLIGTGRVDDNRTPEEEIAALRALYEGTAPDISSTKYRFGNKLVPGLGDVVYNTALAVGLEQPGEQYISKVNGYIEDIFPQDIAMSQVNPFEVTTMAQGGEYGVFKNYIKGDYDGTKREVYAKGLYDKLNRKHYRQAKLAGMSPANYIMTNLVGNS